MPPLLPLREENLDVVDMVGEIGVDEVKLKEVGTMWERMEGESQLFIGAILYSECHTEVI